MITIYALCYNEEVMLPYMIKFYRARFPNCRIVLWDNESTDSTHEIAIANHCEIKTYYTGGKLNDVKYLELKNSWWKDADTDWVLVCDVDELCDINDYMLRTEEERGSSLIRFHGFNMVNMWDNIDAASIKTGVRAESYDKCYLFNKQAISEINYQAGCHKANPVGRVLQSLNIYRCFHYKYLNLEYMIKRHEHFASRLSEDNHKKGYGYHYLYGREKITKEFNEARKNAKVIR